MVLCAAETKEDGTEKVEFVEPPEGGKYQTNIFSRYDLSIEPSIDHSIIFLLLKLH